jgi:hypothetical protein
LKIALVGPSELTEFDKKEIEENLEDFISKGNEIALLAYRSIEIEVFKFFIKNTDDENGRNIAEKLHIYTYQPLKFLPEKIKNTIEYLIEKGAKYTSFEFSQTLIRRSVYIETWQKILEDVEVMVCFYDGEKPTLMIPIDEAKKKDKKAVVYQLPRFNEEHFLLQPSEKIKVVE